MKIKQIQGFFTKVAKDESFKRKIEKLNKEMEGNKFSEEECKCFVKETLLPKAKELGYNFTDADFSEFFKSQEFANLTKLSTDDLENVSGGMFKLLASAIGWTGSLVGSVIPGGATQPATQPQTPPVSNSIVSSIASRTGNMPSRADALLIDSSDTLAMAENEVGEEAEREAEAEKKAREREEAERVAEAEKKAREREEAERVAEAEKKAREREEAERKKEEAQKFIEGLDLYDLEEYSIDLAQKGKQRAADRIEVCRRNADKYIKDGKMWRLKGKEWEASYDEWENRYEAILKSREARIHRDKAYELEASKKSKEAEEYRKKAEESGKKAEEYRKKAEESGKKADEYRNESYSLEDAILSEYKYFK